MTLSKEQLENIQKYASIYLPISDIALLIDVHADELRDEIRIPSPSLVKTFIG